MKKTYIALLLLLTAIALTASLIWKQTPHKRYAVFAGYNKDGTIAPYVITYLKALNEVTNGVVYIADSPLKEGEVEKLKDLTLYTQHIRHNEYDWGSYKRGYNWLKRKGYLAHTDELIFANDSTYAPIGGSFKPMFDKMDKQKELDFWGNSQNQAFTPHIQSYFMVIRRPLLTTAKFRSFLNSISHQPDASMYITEYEVKFTPLLASLGYKWDTYINYAAFPFPPEYDTTDINSYPLTAIRDFKHLFLKRRTFTNNLFIAENRSELLRFIAKTYPQNYSDIAADIAPHFIPADMKGTN